MDLATQSMTAVIGYIKQNPDTEIEAVEVILEQFYPTESTFRLQIYAQAMYDVASTSENTFVGLRDKIVELSLEDLARIMPSIRLVADSLLKPYMEQLILLARRVELETIIANGSPIKTVPDEEAMEFWNMMSHEVMEYEMAEDELERLGG